MKVKMMKLGEIIPYASNPRQNDHAVVAVAASIKEFGFRQPVVVDENMVVLVGHTRLKAAYKLGLVSIPVHVAEGLTEAQKKAYRIADNRLNDIAQWDDELLKIELEALNAEGYDLDVIGFTEGELDTLLKALKDSDEHEEDGGIDYQEKYAVLVECEDEARQEAIFNQLVGLGLKCKVLVN